MFFFTSGLGDVEDRAGAPRQERLSQKQTHLLECGGEEDANRWGLLPSQKCSTCFSVRGQGGLWDLCSQLTHRGLAALLVHATLPSLLVYTDLFTALIWPLGFFDRYEQILEEWRGGGEPTQNTHTKQVATKSDILVLTICLNLHWSCFGDPGNLSFLFTFSVCSSNQVLFARVPVKSTFAAVLQICYCRIQDRDIF